MFGLPFGEIARMVQRTPAATRKLASRARQRIHGASPSATPDRIRQRRVADAYLAATRANDLGALLAVLDPDVVLRVDEVLVPPGAPTEVRGARLVAGRALSFAARSRFARPALVDGEVGIIVAPAGRLRLAFRLTTAGERITGIELIARPARLQAIEIAVLGE